MTEMELLAAAGVHPRTLGKLVRRIELLEHVRKELEALDAAIALVPKSMWDYYEAHGVKSLRECRIRAAAERALRVAFDGRVRPFMRSKHGKAEQDEGGSDAAGSDLRSEEAGAPSDDDDRG